MKSQASSVLSCRRGSARANIKSMSSKYFNIELMETKYRAAVITRTKDRPLFLERALKSVCQQTFSNFIHVIINDGGAVESVDRLVEKYTSVSKHPIKVIHNAESLGMEAASNKAIQSVNSQYIAIHDDDDSWHPDFLNQTISFLDDHREYYGVMATTDRIEEVVLGEKSVQEVCRNR